MTHQPADQSVVSGENAPRIPACDNCKDRKTKCDRGSPCSSCVTAGLQCRLTRTRPERRQRILISTRYDEALESVDHRLQEVLQLVRPGGSGTGPNSRGPAAGLLQEASDFPGGPSFDPVSSFSRFPKSDEGSGSAYRGEPSLEAQVLRTAGPMGLLAGRLSPTLEDLPPRQVFECPPPFLSKYPELTGHTSLPPCEPVLKLLRLAQVEKQRFFIDITHLDEQDLVSMCRDVFFAVNPYTISTWSTVNVSLHFLFAALEPERYSDLGLNEKQVDEITELLGRNAQAAALSFRICEEASLEACQALGLLGMYSIQAGHTPKAYTLFSAASRMCLELGLHCLPPGPDGNYRADRRHRIFWYVFLMDHGLALTMGRPHTIRLCDLSTAPLNYPDDVPGIPGKIYRAFGEAALLEGEMQEELFSVAGMERHPHVRAQKAQVMRARLRKIQVELSRHARHDSILGSPISDTAKIVEIILFSLLTVVCGPASPSSDTPMTTSSSSDFNSGRQQQSLAHACDSCVEAARESLSSLVEVGNVLLELRPKGWARFLNTVLSLAPFTQYLTLVVHIVSFTNNHAHTSHHSPPTAENDLALLATVNTQLRVVEAMSPTARHVLATCTKLFSFAESALAARGNLTHTTSPFPTGGGLISSSASALAPALEFGNISSLGSTLLLPPGMSAVRGTANGVDPTLSLPVDLNIDLEAILGGHR